MSGRWADVSSSDEEDDEALLPNYEPVMPQTQVLSSATSRAAPQRSNPVSGRDRGSDVQGRGPRVGISNAKRGDGNFSRDTRHKNSNKHGNPQAELQRQRGNSGGNSGGNGGGIRAKAPHNSNTNWKEDAKRALQDKLKDAEAGTGKNNNAAKGKSWMEIREEKRREVRLCSASLFIAYPCCLALVYEP